MRFFGLARSKGAPSELSTTYPGAKIPDRGVFENWNEKERDRERDTCPQVDGITRDQAQWQRTEDIQSEPGDESGTREASAKEKAPDQARDLGEDRKSAGAQVEP